jgi:hypothetical protein
VNLDLANLHRKQIARLRTLDIYAARSCVSSVGRLAIGSILVVQITYVVRHYFRVGTTIHLSVDLEPFSRFDRESHRIGSGVFVVESFSRGFQHEEFIPYFWLAGMAASF